MTVTAVLGELLSGDVVNTADVARALGTGARSVNRWATAETSPRRDSEERLLELKAIVDLLGSVMKEDAARLWLRSPNPDLTWRKPLDVVAEGDYRAVVGVILAIAEGVTA